MDARIEPTAAADRGTLDQGEKSPGIIARLNIGTGMRFGEKLVERCSERFPSFVGEQR